MKKILLLLLIMLSVRMAFAQDGKGLSNAVDNSGYCYVTGIVNKGVTGVDILIVKYDQNGDTLWTSTYSGNDISLDDQGVVIKTASNGDIYVAGNIGVVDQDYNVVLLKYSSTGSYLWEQHFPQINTVGTDKALGLAVDINDNAYVTGYRTNGDHTQMFTVKCGPSYGNVRWYKFEDGPDNLNTCGNAITIAHSGNICVTGYTTTISGGIDMFTQEYTASYGTRWQSAPIYNGEANSEDKAFGIAVDDADNVYIVGYASNYADNPNTDITLVKYNPTGGWVWTATYNGGNNGTTDNKAFGIAVDESDNIYITGYEGTTDGGKNYVTIMYNEAGSKQWNTTYAGSGVINEAVSIGLIKDNGVTTGVVVTGSSMGTDSLSDYATIGYDAFSGATTNESVYSLNTTSNDVAQQLAVSSDGTVFVTGFSQVIINAKIVSAFKTQSMKWGHYDRNKTSIGNLPKKFALFQNYPNPFNPSTVIKFDLSKDAAVKLTVYDMLGKQVSVLVDGYLRGGTHEIKFSGANLSSGIYFYELRTDAFREIKKMSLIK